MIILDGIIDFNAIGRTKCYHYMLTDIEQLNFHQEAFCVEQEEVDKLLITLGAKRFAAWQRNEQLDPPPETIPQGSESSLRALLWYVGFAPSRKMLEREGAKQDQINAALAAMKDLLGVVEASDLVTIPADLAREIDEDLRAALVDESEGGLRRLDEKVVNWISEHRVEIRLNESQHRGRPHVVVVLPDGAISVSLDSPPVLLTPHGYRGEASALKVVKKHLKELRKLWDETRPDDQRLPIRSQDGAPTKKKKDCTRK